MFADGSNGSIELVGDRIIIRRKGFANVLTQGIQGDKHIPLRNITSVQFRSAGSWMAGVIQFSIQGGREFRGGMLEATKDENAVMFTREQEPAFAAMRDVIQHQASQPERIVPGGDGSANELERLVALHEKGHLTAKEFADAKGKVLFGQSSTTVSPPAPAAANKAVPAQIQAKPSGYLKAFLILIVAIFGLLAMLNNAKKEPEWGQPGYEPNISEKCRAVWDPANVDSERDVKSVCNSTEQHEIRGYRR